MSPRLVLPADYLDLRFGQQAAAQLRQSAATRQILPDTLFRLAEYQLGRSLADLSETSLPRTEEIEAGLSREFSGGAL